MDRSSESTDPNQPSESSAEDLAVKALLDETEGKASFPDAARQGVKCGLRRFYELRRQWHEDRQAGRPKDRDRVESRPDPTASVPPESPPSPQPVEPGGEMTPAGEQASRGGELEVGGTTAIDPQVVATIVRTIAQSIEGVASVGTPSLRAGLRDRIRSDQVSGRGVEVEVGRREAMITIDIRIIYGFNIPALVMKVRQQVAERLLSLCGLVAKDINVSVVGIDFPRRMPGRVE